MKNLLLVLVVFVSVSAFADEPRCVPEFQDGVPTGNCAQTKGFPGMELKVGEVITNDYDGQKIEMPNDSLSVERAHEENSRAE